MSAPVVTGLLAYGMSGRIFHAPFLHTHPGFRLKAVVERHEKKALGTYPDMISYNSVEDLLNDQEIELVVVNTPGFLHYEQAKQALQAGKHVLIEKPATATLAQVLELFDLAKQLDRQVFIYQNRRWDSDFLSVKEIIESGRLGNLIEVHFRYDRYKPVLSPKAFKETANTPANGLVYDLGPHLLDQVISLFGKPVASHKITGIYRDHSVVPDYFSYQLSYPHQLTVYLTSSLLVAQPLPAFVVHGTAGSYIKNRCDTQEAQLDAGLMPTDAGYGQEPANCEGQLTTMDFNNQPQIEAIPSMVGNYTHLFEAVYQTLVHGALYPITAEHIAWQLELLEAKSN
ncbi:Gfo/Idh/MocA family oxidoreductase [Mucilaginibacter robiniae]|uniref:Gfo/Idh/MocA family oxidoreductase n=1 Tax=Mucilaginibacter robiniae TaxID=2728022 RepID=A0A7L5DZ45_9SPHI|nr:Gfo/Idh/MocA family oxidoreductase [Mucilaginibacter robiniae]QJD96382.1 Gfo/Idh/MocA family oxidoreductase [Mucilaginibacter robiniae]